MTDRDRGNVRRVAIVGAGISGLVAAHILSADREVTVFETNAYAGGHTHTVPVRLEDATYSVDTGFIVHNEKAYPRFVRLLRQLGVESLASRMTFSVRCERTGLEYGGDSLDALFAQRRNLLRLSFLRMIRDVLRFGREAPELLAVEDDGLSLRDYLERRRYSRSFVEHYIVPMSAAIWSSSPSRIMDFPARHLVEFFDHHGVLDIRRAPDWRVIRGGSSTYVAPLTARFCDRIHLSTPVRRVARRPEGVEVRVDGGGAMFDAVVIAAHSDQALALVDQPTTQEREILGALPYQANDVVLHTDATLMPRQRRAWSSWNYHIPPAAVERATVTYCMNILQKLAAPAQLLVTLNRSGEIAGDAVLGRFVYDHPVVTPEAVRARRRHGEINGADRIYYCGAYWGYGFHEDGVDSALAALAPLGAAL